MATITDTTTDANGNIIINVSSSADDAITLATAGTYSDKNIIFNVTTPQSTIQPDWNQNDETQPDYVKNRPFYTGDPVENIFVEESTVSFADAGYGYLGQIQSTFVPTVGETYKVSWDGIDYECTCIESNSTPMLGDINILFGESDPDGEPFLIGAFNGAELRIITLDTSASHTFSIVSRESVAPVVKISPKYLPISFKPLGGSYLTFSSTNNFTLSVENLSKNWDGTLEYFTSDGTWTVWDGAQALVANANDGEYALYLRGIGNTVITGSSSSSRAGWVLIGTDIKCIGNIENLLDYATVKSGKHPNMSSYCYCYMFEDCVNLTKAPDLPAETLTEHCYFYMFSRCTSLTKAPELPAITLASHCYEKMFQDCTSLTQAPALPATMLAIQCYDGMFYGCTSLTQAPALPATTLANYCYDDMFYGCTSLTQVPVLPATTLARECYNDMFAGCTSLKLSSTKTDEYIQEYRIPSSENGVTATNALNGMFFSTGGTFTGTPTINTTYYLSSDDMIVRETDIATLNGYVGSMINNAIPMPDTTLSITGKSADAKATGDAIRALSEEIADLPQPDWNQNDSTAADYVKNRPFYTGDHVETVLVEESTIPFADDGGKYTGYLESTFVPTVGETYKISWDGTAYENTCVNFNRLSVIGNLSLVGVGSDTGEPFLVIFDGGGIIIATADTSASHTISISHYIKSVVKINPKYLPMASETEPGIIALDNLDNNVLRLVKKEYFTPTDFQVSGYGDANTIEECANRNNSYGIYIPGKSGGAVLSCYKNSVNKYITSVLSGGEYINCYKFSQGSLSGEQLWGISKDGVVISSSTANSTKKFKITVDDSGTLTATEVTE